MSQARTETLIIGAGLAGMSCAYHLKEGYLLCEKEERPGGLCVTDEKDGYFFDRTGHWLHLRDEGIKELASTLLGEDQWQEVERKSHVFSNGVYTLYPYQANFHGLPLEVIKENIKGYVEALYHPTIEEPENFEQWVLKHMGEGIAKNFMIPYNHKLWTIHPREMSDLWCQIYVPKPTLDEILDGALATPEREMGYNATFIYPKTGGIGAMSQALADALSFPPLCGTGISAINTGTKSATLSHGSQIGYQHLVSSMPLKHLIGIIDDAPDTIRESADLLSYQSVRYLNVALKNRPRCVDTHWIYFPEPDTPFYRAGFPSNAVASTAPAGKGSVYVEISYRDESPPREIWRQVLEGLIKAGIVESEEDIAFHEIKDIPCAYVLFDHAYKENVDKIHGWLESQGIHSIGRYGRWTYNSMESALIDGREIAQKILNKD